MVFLLQGLTLIKPHIVSVVHGRVIELNLIKGDFFGLCCSVR